MENTEKVQNYKGGEIRRTVDGYYIFVKGDAHSGPYVSISAAKGTVDTTETEAESEPAEPETPVVESADEVVEPEVENTNDEAESEAADTTETEAESADEE
nr:MAG TPA: hypothetical protein [Caudoviricetes sp.]